MNQFELAALIYTAKNATEEVWGPIKREQKPEEYPPTGQQDREEWQRENEPRLVVDNLAWQTYTIVLTNLLQMSSKDAKFERTINQILKGFDKDEFDKDDDDKKKDKE